MRKPLCSGFSCPCAFYIVLFTILFFPCCRTGVSLVVSISLVTSHVYLRPQISLMSCCIVLFVSSGVSPACFCLLALFSLSLSLRTLFCMDYFPLIQICLGIFILATILLQTKLSLSLFKVQVTYNLYL